MARENLTGQTFGRLTAIEYAGRDRHGVTLWLWRCSCGSPPVTIRRDHVKSGRQQSCGCLRRENGPALIARVHAIDAHRLPRGPEVRRRIKDGLRRHHVRRLASQTSVRVHVCADEG